MSAQLHNLTTPKLCRVMLVDTEWGEPSVTCRDNLQRLQNRAARIIRRDSSSEVSKILGWENLISSWEIHKRVFKILKFLHNLVPKYLSQYFTNNIIIHLYNTKSH